MKTATIVMCAILFRKCAIAIERRRAWTKDQLRKIVLKRSKQEKEMGANEPAAPYDEEGYLEVIAKGEDASTKKHKEEGNNGTGSN